MIYKLILSTCFVVFTVGCFTQEGYSQSGIEVIKDNSVPLVQPVWSPSAEKISASHINYSDHESIIYLYDLNTNERTILLKTRGLAIAQSWSVDGIHIIVAVADSIDFIKDGIWVINIADNSTSYIGTGDAAVWSPDGKQLAVFSCTRLADESSSVATIRLINLSDNKEEVLYSHNNCLKNAYLSWSSDQDNILFSYAEDFSDGKHFDQVYNIDLATKEVGQILTSGSWSPSFSPVDDKIVYVMQNSLYVTDGNVDCQITLNNLAIDVIGDISWSPDGEKWALSGLGNIYIVDIEMLMGKDFLQGSTVCN